MQLGLLLEFESRILWLPSGKLRQQANMAICQYWIHSINMVIYRSYKTFTSARSQAAYF